MNGCEQVNSVEVCVEERGLTEERNGVEKGVTLEWYIRKRSGIGVDK